MRFSHLIFLVFGKPGRLTGFSHFSCSSQLFCPPPSHHTVLVCSDHHSSRCCILSFLSLHETPAAMDPQPHPSLSPADHLHRAGARVSYTLQCCISSIYSNRLHHVVAHALILLLRFGQVGATAILTLVFGYMVYEHHTHWCAWTPSACSEYWYAGAWDPKKVPWSYGVVIGTVSFGSVSSIGATRKGVGLPLAICHCPTQII